LKKNSIQVTDFSQKSNCEKNILKIFKFIFNDINHSKFNDFLLTRPEIYETINMQTTSSRAPPPPPSSLPKLSKSTNIEGLDVRED
jgi:hypothetical protein